MCFKFECKNHGLMNVVYYTIKQGYVHRPISITAKVVNLDNTILFKEDDEHYVLKCKCPECDTENTIQLDEEKKIRILFIRQKLKDTIQSRIRKILKNLLKRLGNAVIV